MKATKLKGICAELVLSKYKVTKDGATLLRYAGGLFRVAELGQLYIYHDRLFYCPRPFILTGKPITATNNIGDYVRGVGLSTTFPMQMYLIPALEEITFDEEEK